MQKITTCLWFDHQAEEAARFYVSLFPNSKIGAAARYDEQSAKASGRPEGSVMTVEFELGERKFTALNGGPIFKFTEAVSLVVHCESQQEIDTLWEKLSACGQILECGWLKDRYGLAWQIVPANIGKLLGQDDPARAQRVMQALLQMTKLDIAALERAALGRAAQ